jgi:hypothetical protein
VGRPVGGDDQSWVKSLLDWDSCDFGVLEKVFHSRGQVPEFSNEEDRSFVNGFAQRAARSASVRLVLAEIGGVAVKRCDRGEWESACRDMRARLNDYKRIRGQLRCQRTCDPVSDWRTHSNWGKSRFSDGYKEDDTHQNQDVCDKGCAFPEYYERVGDLLGPDSSDEINRQVRFIHRQTLRGIGTMEMNKLIDTFCN